MNINNLTLNNVLNGYVNLFTDGLQISGESNLPSGPKIIAANHTNGSDPVHLAYISTEKIHCLFQKKLFEIPVLGKLMRESGQICVDREHGRSAYEQACAYLQSGENIALFPEGRLCPRNARIQAKSGAVRMALETGAPIIPLGFYIPPENLITIHCPGLPTGKWQISGKCYARFGEPININTTPSIEEQTNKLMNIIYGLVDQLELENKAIKTTSSFLPAHQW